MVTFLFVIEIVNFVLTPPVIPPGVTRTSYDDGEKWKLIPIDMLSASALYSKWKIHDNTCYNGEIEYLPESNPQKWVAVCKYDDPKAILHLVQRTLDAPSLVSVKMPHAERILMMDIMEFIRDEHHIGICWKSIKLDLFAYITASYVFL